MGEPTKFTHQWDWANICLFLQYLILGGAIGSIGAGCWYVAEAGTILTLAPSGARGKYLALWIVSRNLGQLVGGSIKWVVEKSQRSTLLMISYFLVYHRAMRKVSATGWQLIPTFHLLSLSVSRQYTIVLSLWRAQDSSVDSGFQFSVCVFHFSLGTSRPIWRHKGCHGGGSFY